MIAAGLTALGDSFVEGRGDPAAAGGSRGWVSRLGGQLGLRPTTIRNFGTHGATTGDVVASQLADATSSARAGLYGVVVGVNELWVTVVWWSTVRLKPPVRRHTPVNTAVIRTE